MNPKYLLIFSLGLLLVVSMVTEKGGPLDRFANRPAETASSTMPARPDATAQPKSDFFSDWEAPESSDTEFSGGVTEDATTAPSTPTASWAGGAKIGELTKEQLGVEEATNP